MDERDGRIPLGPGFLSTELTNTATHGVGLGLSIAGLAILVVLASRYGTARHIVACSIYGATLVFLYLASTLYHAAPESREAMREQEKKREDKKRENDDRKRVREPLIALVPPPVPPAPRPPSPLEQRMLAATLSQEVMRQVTPCWSIPAGVKEAHTIRVGVRIFLKPDGHLSGPPEVEDSKRMRSDLAFRAVAESALRALRNPRCSPLRLPLKSFETWREISFNFDPRELLR